MRRWFHVLTGLALVTQLPASANELAGIPSPLGGERSVLGVRGLSAARSLLSVETVVAPDTLTVTLRGDGLLLPDRVHETEQFPLRLMLDFPTLVTQVSPFTSIAQDPLAQIGIERVSSEGARIVLHLSRRVPHLIESVRMDPHALRIVFPRDRELDPAGEVGSIRGRETTTISISGLMEPPVAMNPPDATRSSTAGSMARAEFTLSPARSGVATFPVPTEVAPIPGLGRGRSSRSTERILPLYGTRRLYPVPRVSAQLPGQSVATRQDYTGEPISMDFQNSDLRAVLRVFAEISGLNLVIDASVQGEVNVALTQVPWDQAFDIILRANGLGYEVDGTVVRIASIERLQEEAQARAQLAVREAEAGELVVFTRTLSYARADDLVQLITATTLSPRGEVFTDPRTNTLIIRDLEDRLTTLSDLLDTLDRAEPQVEIEARIVQAGHDSARELGVQWGVTGRAAQGLGTQMPFQFPNTGGVSGRVGAAEGQGPFGVDARALPQENASTAVNLGASAPTSALGITLGAVNGAMNLDVVLSALEDQGELRIISSPRVTTQNNVQAEILQGDQIPYQTVANNTVTVQFKEAALTLRVTPQITAVNTVIMQVELENSFADFARALGDPPIPSIVTQRAITTIQVGDGETTVIGGIYENTQTERHERTPGLHRIPLLGWLFRSEARRESTDELMIFLTPRVVIQ